MKGIFQNRYKLILQNLKSGGKMNNKKVFQNWIIVYSIIFISTISLQAQENIGCFKSNGTKVP